MKKYKKLIACLSIMAMILSQSFCFAADFKEEAVAEYNPLTMTIEERLAWIEENVEAEFHAQGERFARSETLSTTTKTTVASKKADDGTWLYDVGKLVTRVNYVCNSNLTAVEDWSTSTFTATTLITNTIKDTNLTENRISSSKVKLLYEASFTRPEGVYYIEHVYTLNGDGSYSVAVHNFVM